MADDFVRFPIRTAVSGVGHGLVARSERFEVYAVRTRYGPKGRRRYAVTFSAIEVLGREPRRIREVPLPDTMRSDLGKVIAYLRPLGPRPGSDRDSDRRNRRRDPATTNEAQAAQAHAVREGTAGAFDVAADAWEEAGSPFRAYLMRQRATELYVNDAADRLKVALERAAMRGAGEHLHAIVAPEGDYWISGADPIERGKTVTIQIPDPSRRYSMETQLTRTWANRWRAGFGIVTNEMSIGWSEIAEFAHADDAIAHLVAAYERRFGRPTFDLPRRAPEW